METETQTMEGEKSNKESRFGFHPRRAIMAGAAAFGIGLPLLVIASMVLYSLPLLRWTVCDALLGGLAGCLLGMAEVARRPIRRLTLAGLIGGGLGSLMESGLYELYRWIMGSAEPNPQLWGYIGAVPFFLCVAILWGWALGGRKSAARMALYGLLVVCAGVFTQMLIVWIRPGSTGDIAAIAKYILMGALLGWAVARERPVIFPLSPSQSPSGKFVLPRKRIAGCAVLIIAIPLFLCGGIILPRFWHSASEVHTVAQSSLPDLPATFPKIDRHPTPFWPEPGSQGKMSALPHYDSNSMDPFQMDLRSYDLSSLDLRNALPDLMLATFDSQTIWPAADRMPDGFDWMRIMELGKNPGLGIHNLHALGITGRGVGIAIIDQPLIVEHQEYVNQLRLYEEVGYSTEPSSMHGPAVASIAVGKTVGVAPDADLYFIADSMCSQGTYESVDFACLAKSVRRVLET